MSQTGNENLTGFTEIKEIIPNSLGEKAGLKKKDIIQLTSVMLMCSQ
jgi:hypothetical protein